MTGEAVKLGDIATGAGDHERPIEIAGRPPVVDECRAGLGAGWGAAQAAALGVEVERRLRPTCTQVIERVALPAGDLAAVLLKSDRARAALERAERASGLELGQLPVIADEHELAARRRNVIEHPRELTCAEHPRLVEDQDAAISQSVPAVKVHEQRMHARAVDARAELELASGPPRHSCTQHRDPGRLPRLPSSRQGKRLARPGTTAHDHERLRAVGDPADHPGLLRGERAPARQHALDDRGRHGAALAACLLGAIEHAALGGQQLCRGEAPLGLRDRDWTTVTPPPGPIHRGSAVLADQGNDRGRPQHLVGESLERRRVHGHANWQPFAQRRDDVVAGEARPPVRQPVGPQQLADHVLEIGLDPHRRRCATDHAAEIRGMPAEVTDRDRQVRRRIHRGTQPQLRHQTPERSGGAFEPSMR